MSRLRLDLPEAPWVEVPTDGDAQAWAAATAAELTSDGTDALAAELAVAARHARELDAYLCAAIVPEGPAPTVTAVLVVQEVRCQDLDSIAGELAGLTRTYLEVPAPSRVALPLGDAVRLHSVAAAPGGTVVERVEHVVPLGDGTGLRIDLSWSALALGEELVELADAVAAGLGLVE